MMFMRKRSGGRLVAIGALAVAMSTALVLVTTVLAGCGSDADAATTSQGSTSQTSTSATSGGANPGAPDFSGETLDGTAVSLSAYRGKPLVLAFMASW